MATVIFCAVTAQTASLARALGNPVFRYVGKISYGTYLWHFPLFALLDVGPPPLYGYPLLAVRIGVTLVVATGSFYLVEEPIRRGRMRSLTEWKAWLMTSAAFLGVVAVTVVATLPSTAEAAGTVRVVGRPVQRAAGEGGHLRGLGGLAARVRHAGQPAPEQLRREHLQRGHRRLRRGPQHRVPGPRRARPDDPAVQPVDAEVRRSGRHSGRGTWTSSIPTWWWCWPAGGRWRTGSSTGTGCTSAIRRSTPI